ncbi:MAG: helix-turn-helix domain-containing protein [Pseudomonadota bacterium]
MQNALKLRPAPPLQTAFKDLTPVALDHWTPMWSPIADLHILHPQSENGSNFANGYVCDGLAGMRFVSGPQFSKRTARHADQSGDLITIQRITSGFIAMDFESKAFVHRPGVIVIMDGQHAYKACAQNVVGEMVFIPRQRLGLSESVTVGPLLIEEDSAHGRMLLSEIETFFELSSTDAPGRTFSTHRLLHVMSSAIGHNNHPNSERAGWWRARNALIRKHIDSNLGDATLLPAQICNMFNLSRATLYRMFELDGGVRRYIQDRRLIKAVWDLVENGIQRGRLTEVSEKWGFSSNANFNRAVKSNFGMPPGALAGQHSLIIPARLDQYPGAYPVYDWFTQLDGTERAAS